MKVFIILLVAVLLSVSGELLLKVGMNRVGVLPMQMPDFLVTLGRAFTTPAILAGFALIFSGSIFWLATISRVELSWAYPMLSMGYVIAVIASWTLLGEQVNMARLAGVLVVCSGIVIVARS